MTTTFRLAANELDQSFLDRIKAMFREKRVSIVVYEENPLPSDSSNGALDYFMSHPVKIEGFPPFDRDSIYSERMG
jgi:hypothetical protein